MRTCLVVVVSATLMMTLVGCDQRGPVPVPGGKAPIGPAIEQWTALRSPEAAARLEAVEDLAAMGGGARFALVLLSELAESDPDPAVRRRAAEVANALAATIDPPAIEKAVDGGTDLPPIAWNGLAKEFELTGEPRLALRRIGAQRQVVLRVTEVEARTTAATDLTRFWYAEMINDAGQAIDHTPITLDPAALEAPVGTPFRVQIQVPIDGLAPVAGIKVRGV